MLYTYELLDPAGQRVQGGQFTTEDLPNAPGYDPGADDAANAQAYAEWTIGDQIQLGAEERAALRAVVRADSA